MAVAQLPSPAVAAAESGLVPFRRATTERLETLPQDSLLLTASTQKNEKVIEGSGFIYGLMLDVQAPTAGNAAATAFVEDGPFTAIDTLVFKDVNGEIVNLGGYDLYLANLAMAMYKQFDPVVNSENFTQTTGAGATGGTFRFTIDVPIGIDRRTLRGILANQDRAQKYSMRDDYAASGSIYSVAPTTLPTMTVDKYMEYYTVPNPKAPNGAPQEVIPPDFGLIHFLTATSSDTAPAASSTLNHYIRRVGNTVRFFILVLRAGNGTTPRATAAATPPTNIRLKVGEDTLYNETYRARRQLMNKRYGWSTTTTGWPGGVLCYDAIHDFLGSFAGGEVGDDWWYTQALVNAQFIIAWSSAFTAGSSLRIITGDMIYVPPKQAA